MDIAEAKALAKEVSDKKSRSYVQAAQALATFVLGLAEECTACVSAGIDASRTERAEAALAKINMIRNSIIGMQGFNFSEHAYPLVAALDEAGMVGLPYPEARENLGTLIERATKAEDELRFIVSYLAHNDQDANHAWMVRRIRAVLAGTDPSKVEPWSQFDGVRKPPEPGKS